MSLSSEFLPVYVHNALGDASELLPDLRGGKASWRQALDFCGSLRLAGIGSLFLDGDSEGLLTRLAQSGRAFAFALSKLDDGSKRTSQCLPFFDAVAAGDFEGATRVARQARRHWAQGEEYEEDFLFVELLMQRFFLEAERSSCEALLVRYEQALQGTEDVRWGLVKALLEEDGAAFGAALSLYLSERRDRIQRQVKKERMPPELAVTEGYFSVEGLALVRLAERVGLETDEDYLHIPSTAREPLPASFREDSWLKLDEGD
ncbi:Imm49 family immunity protein [Corallococcus terminator]